MVTDIETNLIEGLRERSPKAQQTMVERYGRHVFGLVVRLLPSVEEERTKEVTKRRRARVQIIKLNKELDVKFQNFIKFLNSVEGAPSDWKEIYGVVLKFYSEQSQAYGELYKNVGVLPKSAKDAQKHVNQLMEKYMKEMGKAMTDMK